MNTKNKITKKKAIEIDKRIAKENSKVKTITNLDYKQPLEKIVKRIIKK